MLKQLIEKYGLKKLNTFTKYPSILTLHKLSKKNINCLTDELTTPIQDVTLHATEKIEGSNARFICYGDEYLIGARDTILYHSGEANFIPTQGIVEGLKELNIPIPKPDKLTVIYGEFYGGKSSDNSKWYGKDKVGFRVFDVAVFKDLSILEKPIEQISRWREKQTDNGIIYGQNFLTRAEIQYYFPQYELTPWVDFELGDMTHETILSNLKKYLPTTNVALSESATKKAEGLVLRSADRSVIVKVRYEDYEKTLREKELEIQRRGDVKIRMLDFMVHFRTNEKNIFFEVYPVSDFTDLDTMKDGVAYTEKSDNSPIEFFDKDKCLMLFKGFYRYKGCWDGQLDFIQKTYDCEDLSEMNEVFTKHIEPWCKDFIRKREPSRTFED